MTTESRRVSRDVAVVKGHAWKAIRASGTDARRNTSSSKWFNNLSPQNAPRCDAVDIAHGRGRRAQGFASILSKP